MYAPRLNTGSKKKNGNRRYNTAVPRSVDSYPETSLGMLGKVVLLSSLKTFLIALSQ